MSYELSETPSSIHNSYTHKPLTTHELLFTHSRFFGRKIRRNHRDNYHN